MSDGRKVDPVYARTTEYREQLEEIAAEGVCPFCLEHFRWHPHPILRQGEYWFATRIRDNYQNAKVHFLIILISHKEHITDLSPAEWGELGEMVSWLSLEDNLPGGGLAIDPRFAMRFGPTEYTGASVQHLHAHLIQPELDPNTGRARVVNFPFG